MLITKVTFKPKKIAPVDCKEVSYLVSKNEQGKAIERARMVLKLENRHHKYYTEGTTENQRVI